MLQDNALFPARLHHLCLSIGNAATMIGFYREALGFELSDTVSEGQGVKRACFLRSDPEHHSFAVFHAELKRLLTTVPPENGSTASAR